MDVLKRIKFTLDDTPRRLSILEDDTSLVVVFESKRHAGYEYECELRLGRKWNDCTADRVFIEALRRLGIDSSRVCVVSV